MTSYNNTGGSWLPKPSRRKISTLSYQVLVCRECGGKMQVARTDGPIRHMKCAKCGRIVKVIEKTHAI